MANEWKQTVIRIGKQAQHMGLCKHKSGNVSVIDPETGYVYVTPSGIDRDLLKEEDICVLTKELKLLEGAKPSSEALMHIECYKARPDIRAVVHTHSRMATAFAVLNKPIPATVYEMFAFPLANAEIPVAPYGRPGTQDLADKVAEVIKHNNLALMERHGTIAVADNADDALLAAAYIEELAEIYYYTLQINGGKEPPVFTRDELDAWQYPDKLK